MSAKRILTIVIFIIALAVLVGLGYFLVVPKKAMTVESQAVQSQTAPELKSFRGVLGEILDGIKETTGEITGAISNPFAKKEAATASPPSSGNDGNFTFAVIGDTQYFTSGNSQGNFQKAAAEIQEQNPDMVIAVGDLIRNCKGEKDDAQDLENWKKILGPLLPKTYAVQGNHERVESVDKCDRIWTDAFSFPTDGPQGFAEFAYSVDFENSHFVFLDSNKPDGHQVNKTQRDWLEQDLAKNKRENVFVIFHEPAFPTGYKKGESLDTEASQRDALWQIIDKYNVTGVFNGHEHIVSRRKIDSKVFPGAKNSVYQFGFGSTDSFDHTLPAPGVAEFANQGQGRYGIVHVNGKEITVETHGPDGKIIDTFTFSK